MSKVFKIIMDILLIILIIALSGYIILRTIGIVSIYKVETGSMEDGIHAGDYILIYSKKDYKLGDVVTYKKDNYFITHRIVRIVDDKVITKGDANNANDAAIDISSIVGLVIYSGGLLNILIDFKFTIAGLLIGLYLLSSYFESRKEEENKSEVVL